MAIVNFRWASQTFYLSFYTFIYSRTISLITVFSQYLKNVKIPFPGYSRDKGMYMARLALFRMFPVSCNIIYLFGQIKVFTSVVRIVRDLSKPHLIKICIIFWLTDKFHETKSYHIRTRQMNDETQTTLTASLWSMPQLNPHFQYFIVLQIFEIRHLYSVFSRRDFVIYLLETELSTHLIV